MIKIVTISILFFLLVTCKIFLHGPYNVRIEKELILEDFFRSPIKLDSCFLSLQFLMRIYYYLYCKQNEKSNKKNGGTCWSSTCLNW